MYTFVSGFPPDSLTVDHSNIYCYNKTEKLLYIMDKQTSIVTTKSLEEVHDMIGYGTHLQPLPCKYNESGITFGKKDTR